MYEYIRDWGVCIGKYICVLVCFDVLYTIYTLYTHFTHTIYTFYTHYTHNIGFGGRAYWD